MVATAATLGNLLVGWDSSTIAGLCVFLSLHILLSICVYCHCYLHI